MCTDFYSIERLVEFGLSLAVSQQMVNSMNQTIQQMTIPSSEPPRSLIYVAIDGKPVGPLSERDFVELLDARKITKDTLIWMPGMSSWQTIESTPSALKLIALTPPPLNSK